MQKLVKHLKILQEQLISSCLFSSNLSEEFTIETDASDIALGEVLSQNGRPVAFYSRAIEWGDQYLAWHDVPDSLCVPSADDAELEAAAAEKLATAEARATQLQDLKITIEANAGDEGKLFGSVGTRDIADAITEAGVEVTKAEVRLPLGALRETGEFEIAIHLHTDVDTSIKVNVIAEA